MESGVVSQESLEHALAQQKRVGEILVEQHAATPQQIEQALLKQKHLDVTVQSKKTDTASIRVDTAKIDKLINLVGELVITQSMLSDLGARFEMNQLHVLLERMAQLERNTREIQERVMSIRMLPIGTAFSRFPRLVRDLSAKAGKKIQLILSGEETELDKTVIESIGDPLTHGGIPTVVDTLEEVARALLSQLPDRFKTGGATQRSSVSMDADDNDVHLIIRDLNGLNFTGVPITGHRRLAWSKMWITLAR